MKAIDKIENFRDKVPAANKWVYLETAGTGLIPEFVYEGVRRYQDQRFYEGGDSSWLFGGESLGTLGMIERSKQELGIMLGCESSEIAFGQSSTQMFTLVSEGIPFQPEDNVVTVDKGWIGNRYSWQSREDEGLNVKYVEPVNGFITAEMIMAACDEHTRAVTVNYVESVNGYRMDVDALGEFCSERGIYFLVDAVQAAGALKIDVKKSKIDFLCGNDYKWMMNFCGTGYAYIGPRLMGKLKHWGAGWMTDSHRFDTSRVRLEKRTDAGQYEIGYPHADGIYGMGLVAEYNNSIGMENIEAYVLDLAKAFRNRVENTQGLRLTYSIPEHNLSQIISITADASVTVTNEQLEQQGIFAHFRDANERGEREMRLSFHYYNNMEDVNRFFHAINNTSKVSNTKIGA